MYYQYPNLLPCIPSLSDGPADSLITLLTPCLQGYGGALPHYPPQNTSYKSMLIRYHHKTHGLHGTLAAVVFTTRYRGRSKISPPTDTPAGIRKQYHYARLPYIPQSSSSA